MRADKRSSSHSNKKTVFRPQKKGQDGGGKKRTLLDDAVAHMNAGKYGRASSALKQVLAGEPEHPEALRLFATLHLKLGSLMAAKTSFDSLARKAIEEKDYRLAESLLREYLAVAPRYVPFLELLGQALEAEGDSVAAIEEYGKAVDILVEDRDPEQMTQATELYEKIKQLGPDSSVAKKFVEVFEAASPQATVETPRLKATRDEGATAQFPWAPTEDTEVPAYTEEPDASPQSIPELMPQPPVSEEPAAPSLLPEATEVPDTASPLPWEEPAPAAEPTSLGHPEQQEQSSPTVQGQVPPKRVTESGESTKKPWERQGTPAPFPWEVTDESAEAPAVSGFGTSAESLSAIEEASVPAATSEPAQDSAEELPASAPQDDAHPQVSVLDPTRDESTDVTPAELSVAANGESERGDQVVAGRHDGPDTAISEPPVEEESLPEDDLKILSRFLSGQEAEPVSEVPSGDSRPPVTSEELSLVKSVDSESGEPDGHQTEDASLAQAAAEALAALQGEPGASVTPAAPTMQHTAMDSVLEEGGAAGTVELPQEDNLQTGEASLAQAAAEALEALKEDHPVPPSADTSPTESIIPEPALIQPLEDVSAESSPQEGPEAEVEPLAQIADSLTNLEEVQLEAPTVSDPDVAQHAALQGDDHMIASDPTELPAIEIPSIIEEGVSHAFAESGEETTAIEDQISEQTIQPVESPPVMFKYATEEVSHEADPTSVKEETTGGSAEPADVVPHEAPKTVLPWDPVGQPLAPAEEVSNVEATPALPAEEPVDSAPNAEAISFPQGLEQDDAEPPASSPLEETPAARAFDLGILFPGEKDLQTEQVAPPAPSRVARPVARATSPTWAVPQMQEASQEKVSTRDLFPSLSRLRFKVKALTRKTVSTVRTIVILSVVLMTGLGLLGLVGVAVLSLTWVGMEDKPTASFHSLTQRPPRPTLGADTNGYSALSRIGMVSSREPLRAVNGRTIEPRGGREGANVPSGFAEVGKALSGWYETWDPAAEFQKEASSLKDWSTQYSALLARYHRWVDMRFEDLGYGSVEGPDEFLILSAHRLYVAEGFTAGVNKGVRRLAEDLEAWRRALEKSKTLRIKMLAVEGIQDDLAVVSGLLAQRNLNLSLLPTLAKLSRPLTHQERSLRWPMQNQFVLEADQVRTNLKSDSSDTRPLHRKVLTYLPLPFQKTMNAHAAFYDGLVKYDAVIKLEGDPRKGMPERYAMAKTPARSLGDYIVNPIDNLLQVGPRIDWREMTGRVLETEARLRLATLQARIRRPPQARDPISRIGKAGHDFYDPFTGFTMLLNASKTRMYSVGMDGVDNDADPRLDVTVPLIPQGR